MDKELNSIDCPKGHKIEIIAKNVVSRQPEIISFKCPECGEIMDVLRKIQIPPLIDTCNDISKSSIQARYHGFDYLRAIFCIVIVMWHTTAFNYVGDPILNYLAVYYLGLLAVPVFFQTSLFLYTDKILRINEEHSKILKNRIKDLAFLYLFWLPVNLIILYNGNLIALNDSPYILMGNGTPLYFIFDLILLTIVSHIILAIFRFLKRLNLENLSRFLVFITFGLSLVIMFIGVGIIHYLFDAPLFYANPLNYVPYVFSSIILVQRVNAQNLPAKERKKKDRIFIITLLSLIFLSAIFEKVLLESNWPYLKYNYFEYARISIVLFAMLIVYASFQIKRPPPKIIRILSELSLGVFVTHIIMAYYVTKIFDSISISVPPLLLFCCTFCASSLFVYILKRYLNKII